MVVAGTTIKLAGTGVEAMQTFDLQISVEVKVNLDAETARRKVTNWLVSEVGNMLFGGKPQLVISRQSVWHVPVMLGSFDLGTVGEVGAVDVDTVTGKMMVDNKLRKQLLDTIAHVARPVSTTAR
jgi:hypothetical protein